MSSYKSRKQMQVTKDISSRDALEASKEGPVEDMGLTFGGDMGFKVESALSEVKNAVESVNKVTNTLENKLKKDMLLSFYDWPSVESSTILSSEAKKHEGQEKKQRSVHKEENYISSDKRDV